MFFVALLYSWEYLLRTIDCTRVVLSFVCDLVSYVYRSAFEANYYATKLKYGIWIIILVRMIVIDLLAPIGTWKMESDASLTQMTSFSVGWMSAHEALFGRPLEMQSEIWWWGCVTCYSPNPSQEYVYEIANDRSFESSWNILGMRHHVEQRVRQSLY